MAHGNAVPALVLALSGCTEAAEQTAVEPTPAITTSASDTPTAAPPGTSSPCDPGFGFPTERAGCPDPEPETAWLSRSRDGQLQLKPFRSLTNDAEGRAYAEEQDLEFPFSNDTFDLPDGPARVLDLGPDTVCTGIIQVGYREPLADHLVSCVQLVRVAARQRLTVAVWSHGRKTVQVSELYRP